MILFGCVCVYFGMCVRGHVCVCVFLQGQKGVIRLLCTVC